MPDDPRQRTESAPAEAAPGAGEPVAERVPVGIILERRKSHHPWLDYAWKAVDAVAGAPPRDPLGDWTITDQGDEWVRFHAGTLMLSVFPGVAVGYRLNLCQMPPRLFVVVGRPDRPGALYELAPFHVTACPFEAQEYLDGDDTVEPVTMPPNLIGFLEAFVARCPLPPAFQKRRRKSWREGGREGGKAGGAAASTGAPEGSRDG
ncbi:MAG: DUF3305 domain-containing protein [Tistlia sp.]|uniref:DUF3305 domain-containing protein n=1 Tax=Tistlia sp. TaxID=3057121 RepID=UPI0034A23D55